MLCQDRRDFGARHGGDFRCMERRCKSAIVALSRRSYSAYCSGYRPSLAYACRADKSLRFDLADRFYAFERGDDCH